MFQPVYYYKISINDICKICNMLNSIIKNESHLKIKFYPLPVFRNFYDLSELYSLTAIFLMAKTIYRSYQTI